MPAIISLTEGGDREVQEEVGVVARQVNIAIKQDQHFVTFTAKDGGKLSIPAKNVKEIAEPAGS